VERCIPTRVGLASFAAMASEPEGWMAMIARLMVGLPTVGSWDQEHGISMVSFPSVTVKRSGARVRPRGPGSRRA
jgi:hypothetical protein